MQKIALFFMTVLNWNGISPLMYRESPFNVTMWSSYSNGKSPSILIRRPHRDQGDIVHILKLSQYY